MARVKSSVSEGQEVKIHAFVCLSNVFLLLQILQFRIQNVTVIKKIDESAF